MKPRLLEIRKGVLEKNDLLADGLRRRFHTAGVYALNWVSSPGTGKTALLEATLRRLRERGLRVAALVGDVATENDANRLARSGAPVRQIVTGGNCHLEADMIESHLTAAGWDLNGLDFLFIENVGNLVCPSSYDLGEDLRVVLLSVTEGEDKPLKYPSMFNSSDVAMITKIDLAEAVEFDRASAYANLEAVRPGLRVFETSAKTGKGVEAWVDFLVEQRASRRPQG
ncbi:MAG TPA: hydrogenase nickel incorporation protein HypB [Anaerolineales bacterium]|nr:hydrogenase nickel incorporation protein HypB [Anaerolineales bacterium]